MAIQTKEITYGAYGRCVQITNDLIEVVVTVDAGPRIIRYGFTGRENMFCEAPDKVGENGWRIMGGHRLWHSPEHDPRTYEPEDKPVKWEKIEGGIRTVQEVEPWALMAKEMDIVLDDDSSEVSIIHRIRNCGAWPVELAVWALSVMAPGGKEVVPMTQRDTGLLGNRVLGLWPYSNMGDHRVWWGQRYITLKQDPACKPPFKFGINNEYGWAAYFNYNQVFIKQFIHEMDEKYPDGGASYETYTTDFMLEMESLSPIMTVQPGEEIDHMECWYLVDDVAAPENCDDKIDEIMDDLLGDCCDCEECEDGCCCCEDDDDDDDCCCEGDCCCDEDDNSK
jgi:hypothetical protein